MRTPWLAWCGGLVLAGLCVSLSAQAVSLVRVSPQGEVADVRQVMLRFSEAVVPLGDLRQPAPATISCQGGSAAGTGHWNNDREWVHDLAQALPPGVSCSIDIAANWKPLKGSLSGAVRYRFTTGGPTVRRIDPYTGSRIEEDQLFLVHLTGPVVEAEVPAHAWCEVEGLGETLPVTVVTGAVRGAILKARKLQQQPGDRLLVLGCGRPFPQQAKVRLVWGKGMATPGNPTVVTSKDRSFDFQVREAFTADFSCERERAAAPCLPIRPLRVRFSAPVPRELAAQARLVGAGDTVSKDGKDGKAGKGSQGVAPFFDKDDKATEVSEIQFKGPLAEAASFTIVLPEGLKDVSGRPLANASSYPLKLATGEAPPIAKFAAAPFGVVEWGSDSVVPVTLRHVQPDLRAASAQGQVRIKRLTADADIIRWYRKLSKWHESSLPARELGLPRAAWYEFVEDTDAKGRAIRRQQERYVGTRELSLLKDQADARRLTLPQLDGGDPRPFEVVGIPLTEPGYQVLEIESGRLGRALLDKAAPMYVRTGVLVTNLGVHIKQGRENAVVWVTTLDRGRPVAEADVAVSDCNGKPLWRGRTDTTGLARIPSRLEPAPSCGERESLFVSARKADAQGVVDTAFVFNGWNDGIEPWRFSVPTSDAAQADVQAHTVFDRTLLRAGETVSMKHFIRRETLTGLALLAKDELPTQLRITHRGSGDEQTLPLTWRDGRASTSSWNIPPAAKLGFYDVELETPAAGQRQPHRWPAGDFRVEEFRLPLLDARLYPPRGTPVAPTEVALSAQLNYQSGGAVAQAPLTGSAVLRSVDAAPAGFEDYSFSPARHDGDGDGDGEGSDEGRVVADKIKLVTDRNGAATFTISNLPAVRRPSELVAEITFSDPNGEVQTVSSTVSIRPAAVQLGIKSSSWTSNRGKARFTALALGIDGKPVRGQAVEVRGRLSQHISTRKRMVGGFYAYDNRTEYQDLGLLCQGQTDDRGLLACDATLDTAGQVELLASSKDALGHAVQAATSIWVTRQGELWFEQDNDDRIDVLPERKRYEPGETARIQVRMPFREATALVAVEREGVIDTRVITLRGDDPGFDLPIDKAWAPNVYVSVMALRGRIRDVRWYSFFDWGWKAPVEWARAFWYEGREYQAPTAMVDLSKPSYKFGMAALTVGRAAHELQVKVSTDKTQYAVRGKSVVRIQVSHDGKPVPGAMVAFAAVDESLLALRDNTSWQLLQGLIQTRAWGVQTATAQGEIIGRRHYGRKALAAGGGGGRSATRELFDTLLLWRPEVTLDAQGEAVIEVPLNDSLTSYRFVAVADAGTQQFGTGKAVVKVTQDLQILSGLPPLVRDGDRFSAMLTLRNTTRQLMTVRATLKGTAHSGREGQTEILRTALELPPQDLQIPAEGAQVVTWPVDVPEDVFSIHWEASVLEQGGAAHSDRLKVTQQVSPAVPLRVLQASLMQLEGTRSLPVLAPADALSSGGVQRGGLVLGLQPRLSGALPGIRRYFETYPFVCLEQKASKAVGLKDAALWATVSNELGSYLDGDGLANYFPPRASDERRGSDRLTAYVLAATHEAGFELPGAPRQRMLDGLAAFVEGRIERRFWSPRADLDVRKLAAIEALSRYGRAQARQLGSIRIAPEQWPTAAVIDWLQILHRMKDVPDRDRHLEEANRILRARLNWAGTTLRFSNEADDFWWWLMDSADANAARLILAVLNEPDWKDDLPRLVVGTLGRQNRGAWLTTTANLWGSLALDKFALRFESSPITGRTQAVTAGAGAGAASSPGAASASPAQAIDWRRQPEGGRLALAWPPGPDTLTVTHEGTGAPWLTVQSVAAVPLLSPLSAGYRISRSVEPVQQKVTGRWSRGDVMRVRVSVTAQADMTWVVVSDPVPGGATILGSGLGRDSQIATRGEQSSDKAWPTYEERSFEAFRSYFAHLPRGTHVVEYTLRLNNAGRFLLPPTRTEAMYAPETFGEVPNEPVEVAP
jgi:alpha-2-macroglobulin